MLAEFLEALFNDGRVVVPKLKPLRAEQLSQADRALQHYEQIGRQAFPGQAPPFDIQAGRWAAVSIFRACQFAIDRDLGVAAIRDTLRPIDGERTISTHYSVDLCMRFLPSVYQLAQVDAEDDPLLAVLKQWAVDWPLSSVGMPLRASPDLDVILQHAAARQCYIDRVVAANDRHAMRFPVVREHVAAAIGMHPDLAPDVHRTLTELGEGIANNGDESDELEGNR